MHDREFQQRTLGCWLGQLTGDALGSMVEFRSGADIAREYPHGLRAIGPSSVWKTLAGQPTDDSELALALARTLLRDGRYDPVRVGEAYCLWKDSGPFDIGITISNSLSAVSRAQRQGEDVTEAARRSGNTESQANGALMRQSPLGIWGWSLPLEELDRIARLDARLTHPNQVCEDASAVFVVTLAGIIHHGRDGEEAYNQACRWDREHSGTSAVRSALEAARGEQPTCDDHRSGWVLVALQNAFYVALHAPTFEEGVVATVIGGGDTDTNAAIAGALLGAIHGVDAIPEQWREAVLQCRPQEGAPGVRWPRPEEFWPVDALELAEELLRVGSNGAALEALTALAQEAQDAGDYFR